MSKTDSTLSLDQEMNLNLELTINCRKCGVKIDQELRRYLLVELRLFGIGYGWRLCDCRQMLVRGWGPDKEVLNPLEGDESWRVRKPNRPKR